MNLTDKPRKKYYGSISNQNTQFFTSEKLIDLIVIFFLFKQILIYGCIEQSHSIL